MKNLERLFSVCGGAFGAHSDGAVLSYSDLTGMGLSESDLEAHLKAGRLVEEGEAEKQGKFMDAYNQLQDSAKEIKSLKGDLEAMTNRFNALTVTAETHAETLIEKDAEIERLRGELELGLAKDAEIERLNALLDGVETVPGERALELEEMEIGDLRKLAKELDVDVKLREPALIRAIIKAEAV